MAKFFSCFKSVAQAVCECYFSHSEVLVLMTFVGTCTVASVSLRAIRRRVIVRLASPQEKLHRHPPPSESLPAGFSSRIVSPSGLTALLFVFLGLGSDTRLVC